MSETIPTPRTDAFAAQPFIHSGGIDDLEAGINRLLDEWNRFAIELETDLAQERKKREEAERACAEMRDRVSVIRSDAHYINADWLLEQGHSDAYRAVMNIRGQAEQALSTPAPVRFERLRELADGMRDALKRIQITGISSCEQACEKSLLNEEQHKAECFIHRALAAYEAFAKEGRV